MATRKWGSETVVSTTQASLVDNSKVAGLAGGGYVVVWEDNSSGSLAIRAQIFDDLGNRSGGEFAIADFPGFNYAMPDVTALADGSFYVTATELGATNNSIIGSVWSADGTVIRSQHAILTAGLDADSDAAGLGTGSVVVWTGPESGSNDIYMKIFDAAGVGGSVIGVNIIASGSQTTPSVNATATGNTLAVVWLNSNDSNIAGRLFDASGTALGGEFGIATGGVNEPVVKWLNGGEFVVTWVEGNPFDHGGTQIKARIFNGQGAQGFGLTGNIAVNSTTLGDQIQPDITVLPNGGFVISWTDFSQTGADQSGGAIRLQAFDGAGGKIGGEYLVNTTTDAFDQDQPSITALADGRVVVTWTDVGIGGDHIMSQIIDTRDGVVTGTGGADTLYGNAAVNDEISGFNGDDTLIGMNGDDQLFGGAGNDTANGGRGDDSDYGGAGNDLLLGASGDDDLFGEDGNDDLRGGIGADALDGGAGRDTASYILAKSAVVVALDGTLAATGEAAGDSFIRIEDLTGSNLVAQGDTLKGNAAVNLISGLAGDDILLGGGGGDVLAGGRGADTMTGGAGNDRFSYAALTEVGDVITDFSSLAAGDNDSFQFKASAFGGLMPGTLAANQFQSSASSTAATADVRFFYETDTGILRFDADGNLGGTAAIIIATLQPGATMTIADIAIL